MRIAICDDLQTERQKTIEALDSVIRNFSVNEFDDGAELIKSHEVLPYDLIILDILMPKISGMDTAAQIRKKIQRHPSCLYRRVKNSVYKAIGCWLLIIY